MAKEIINMQIKNVTLTMADHGCLTFFLTLEGGGYGVNVGGYCIGHGFLGSKDFRVDNGAGLVAIMNIMNVIGVERWEDLKGHYCRIESESWGSTIHKIGNILEDKWFDLKDFFANYEATK